MTSKPSTNEPQQEKDDGCGGGSGANGQVFEERGLHLRDCTGVPLEEVVYTDQQLCETGVRADRELASDTTIGLLLGSFGQISHDKYWPEVVNLYPGAPRTPRLIV